MISTWRADRRPVSLRETAALLQAVGHPVRLQILEALRPGPATVTAIVDRLALEQPVVSRHLAVLRRAGALSVEPIGRERIYQTTQRTGALIEVLFRAPTKTNQGATA